MSPAAPPTAPPTIAPVSTLLLELVVPATDPEGAAVVRVWLEPDPVLTAAVWLLADVVVAFGQCVNVLLSSWAWSS